MSDLLYDVFNATAVCSSSGSGAVVGRNMRSESLMEATQVTDDENSLLVMCDV